MTRTLILASSSPFRRQLMDNAGLRFSHEESGVDERELEAGLPENLQPGKLALSLAVAKARAVSARQPSALVLGCDQTMSLGSDVFHKSPSRAAAAATLRKLRGQTHHLNSAMALVMDGDVLWSHIGVARMTMRPFSDRFLEAYLDDVGDKVFRSVGSYQLEGRGIQLFDQIDGDYFTIIGLPLLPLLEKLRELGEIDA